RRPEVLLLQIESDVVLGQLVLAIAERVEDTVQLALGGFVAAEVIHDLVAERDHSEKLAHSGRLARVEVLDRAAQLEQGVANLGPFGDPTFLEGAYRSLQQTVRGLCRATDVRVSHGTNIGGLFGELR